MNFWSVILDNLPLTILLILAIIVCGADFIKAGGVWKDAINKKKTEKSALNKDIQDIKNILSDIQKEQEKQKDWREDIDQKIKDLTVSDMHDIKSWIVEQYYKFYVYEGRIDAFNAEVIERRYEDYKKEGGNSYIDTLMERLHTLPMDPPNIR